MNKAKAAMNSNDSTATWRAEAMDMMTLKQTPLMMHKMNYEIGRKVMLSANVSNQRAHRDRPSYQHQIMFTCSLM